jgi:hypothetical protein
MEEICVNKESCSVNQTEEDSVDDTIYSDYDISDTNFEFSDEDSDDKLMCLYLKNRTHNLLPTYKSNFTNQLQLIFNLIKNGFSSIDLTKNESISEINMKNNEHFLDITYVNEPYLSFNIPTIRNQLRYNLLYEYYNINTNLTFYFGYFTYDDGEQRIFIGDDNTSWLSQCYNNDKLDTTILFTNDSILKILEENMKKFIDMYYNVS